jgi:DNA-binding response OmpR family regulator
VTREVLIIEGSLTVRMDLKETFETAGYKVFLCATGKEAREQLARHCVALVVLDAVLPDDDSVALLKEVKEKPETNLIPVILLSNERDVGHRPSDPFSRADLCLEKPYDRVDLVARANELLAGLDELIAGMRMAPREDSPLGPMRILAVDDSLTYLHAVAEQLGQDGHGVALAHSGEEALAFLERESADCVLLDLIMPGLSGEETCRRIKGAAAWHRLPVIMLTAREDREAMIASFNAGADDFISKSSEFPVLRARLRAHLRRRALEVEHHRTLDQLHHKEIEAAESRANRELAEARAAHMADLERKNAELTEAKAVAERANHAKDHFLAVLSHELRTPLTPVLATISMLQEEPGFSEDARQSFEVIRRNIDLEARLIDDLLDLTRIVRGKVNLDKRLIELSEVIRRAVEVCQPDIEARHLEFGVDIGSAAPYMIEADAARLQQVFWNLLKNSIKFTPRGGCIGIRCYVQHGQVVAEVNDSGQGIPPEALDRIFNAFEQAEHATARQFGGLGLGLAISKALLEMHGGTIEAHSAGTGKGATFRVRLPLRAKEEPRMAPRGAALRPDSLTLDLSGLTLLLVEDHGDTSKIMKRLLERYGCQVLTAGDVESALGIASRSSIDLLISDLGLPDASGLDLMRKLREIRPDLKGIAVSGYGMEADIERSRAVGFADHVTKPVDFKNLEGAIRRAMSR